MATKAQRHPDAQRLFATRRTLRQVTKSIERTASMAGTDVQDVQTLAQDCAIQITTLLEKLKEIRAYYERR